MKKTIKQVLVGTLAVGAFSLPFQAAAQEVTYKDFDSMVYISAMILDGYTVVAHKEQGKDQGVVIGMKDKTYVLAVSDRSKLNPPNKTNKQILNDIFTSKVTHVAGTEIFAPYSSCVVKDIERLDRNIKLFRDDFTLEND